MDISTVGSDFLEFDVRGIHVRLTGAAVLPVGTTPESYAISRFPIPNGQADRISHRGLTVDLAPQRSNDERDTYISPGVEVGSDVSVGARTKIETAVVIGPKASIGDDCIVGEHAHIGSDVVVGDNNHIPPFAIVAQGVHIPPGTFKFGTRGPSSRDMMTEITQEVVDARWDSIGAFAR